MVQLTPTAACLLGLLELGPLPGTAPTAPDTMTGWQLYETARDSLTRFWNLTRSQIYLELSRLAAAGLLEATSRRGPRASRPYRLTPAGKAAFRAWLLAWALAEPKDDQLHSPLLLTVFFGDFLPRDVFVRTLQEYRLRYARRLARVEQILAAIGPADQARPPTAVLRRGRWYAELMGQWLEEVMQAAGGPADTPEPSQLLPAPPTEGSTRA
jgi:DNA-binding PadR family transcriptional regulator